MKQLNLLLFIGMIGLFSYSEDFSYEEDVISKELNDLQEEIFKDKAFVNTSEEINVESLFIAPVPKINDIPKAVLASFQVFFTEQKIVSFLCTKAFRTMNIIITFLPSMTILKCYFSRMVIPYQRQQKKVISTPMC